MTDIKFKDLVFNGNQTVRYSFNTQHRNHNPNKSQWTITEDKEVDCFKESYVKGWKSGDNAWGLHYELDVIQYLGQDRHREHLISAMSKNTQG